MLQWILENTLIAMAMAVGVCIACRYFRAKPAVCHFLWALVLVRLVAPPVSVTHWPPAPMRSHVAGWIDTQASTLSKNVSHYLSLSGGTHNADNRSVSVGSAAPVQPNPIEPALQPEEKPGTVPAVTPAFDPAPIALETRVELETNIESASPSAPSEESSQGYVTAPSSQPETTKLATSEPDLPVSEMSMSERKREETAWKDLYSDKRKLSSAALESGGAGGVPLGVPNFSSGWWRIASLAAVSIWMCGAVIALFIHGRRIARFHAAVRQAPLASDWLTGRVRRLANDLGTLTPKVRILPGLTSPVIWGFGTPTLLWPADDAALAQRDPQRCDGIIVHELAHVRRRDHWMAWFEIVAISLLWWHPLAHLACRRLHEFADLACDSWVVSTLPTHRRTYAASIVDLIEQLSTAPRAALALGVGTSSRRALVERRLVMIVKERTSCRLSPVAAMLALVGAAFLMPSWAGGALEFSAPPAAVSIDSAIAPDHQAMVKQAILKRRAETFFESKDWQSAASAYQAIVDGDADNAHAAHRLSYSLIALGELDRAQRIIEREIDKGHEPAIGHYNLACIMARRGETERAFQQLGKAITYGFDQTDLISTDTDLDSLRDDDRFRGFAGDAMFVASLDEQGGQAIGGGDAAAAVVHYGKLAKLAPNYGQAHHMLSYSSILASRDATGSAASEHLNRARTALQTQLKLDFLPGIARYNLACVDSIEGKVDAGLKNLEASIELGFKDVELMTTDPDLEGLRSSNRFAALVATVESKSTLHDEIDEAMDEGDFDRVAQLMTSLGKDKGDYGDVSWSLGYALFNAGDYDGAQAAFVRSLESGHAAGDAIYNLACCQAKMGNSRAALGYLAAAVDAGFTDGDHIRQDDDLASIRGEKRFEELVNKANDENVLQMFGAVDWTHLLTQSEAAIAKDSTKGAPHLRHGWALLRLGRHEEALRAFERQRELGFATAIASYNIACCQTAMGRTEDAIAVLNQLSQEDHGGTLSAEFIANDPDLKALHSHPRFDEIVNAFDEHEHHADHAEAHDHTEVMVKEKADATKTKPGR